ncbi:MAG: Gfo/Idh/MocA family oxidoreductase [Acidobacteriaceae bacterium]
MKPLRIGVVGAGAIVRNRHLPNLRSLPALDIPAVEISVVCNRNRASAEAFARDFDIPEVAATWERVVTRPDLDIIWIGTTPSLHAPITIAALDAGKHVFCQARMAMNLSEARSMLAAAESHPSQVTMLCPPPNAMKHGLFLEHLLRERAIGRIYHFHLRSLSAPWADPAAPAHWRQRTELSGNNILSVGIYGEVLGRFFGDPVSLCASGRVFIPQRQGYELRVPDAVSVLGDWPDQILGTLEWSGVAHNGGHDRLEIFGSDCTLTYDFVTDEIFLGRSPNSSKDSSPASLQVPAAFTHEWTVEQDFIRAVHDGGHPEPSFRTGVRYMTFVEAIHQSLARSAWVRLAEL